MAIKTGDILNFDYTGAVQVVTLPKGIYKLECWGAQGGNAETTSDGGKGGYSVGTITINKSVEVYIYSGGAGQTSSSSAYSHLNGGFNGGGKSGSYYGGSGGGGSDIRIGQDSLYARVIAAGGGGGGWYHSGYNGGFGGGETGGAGSGYNSTYEGRPGTQTSGGDAVAYGGTSSPGEFGVGGDACQDDSTRNRSAGGGGGWYGGGGTTYRNNSSRHYQGGSGAGGGSGYVYTATSAANYPTGCLLTATYYLTDAITKDGGLSFLAPDGTTETGHNGNGYVRITVIKTNGLNMPVNVDDTWKDSEAIYVNIGGAWKEVEAAFVNIGGVWKELG